MRVIAGTARSLPLKTIEGRETRPTTDRIKETLFNMLSPFLANCRFLDIFSGSGAIGIEALSRGAESCVFIEKNRRAVQCIKENLEFTHLGEKAVVLNRDAKSALSALESGKPYSVVFMDPPYESDFEDELLTYLASSGLIDAESLIVVEAKLSKSFDFVKGLGFEITKEKRYKTNKHVFMRRSQK